VLLHSSPTATGVAGTTGDQPMLHSQSPASIIPEQLRWTGRQDGANQRTTVTYSQSPQYVCRYSDLKKLPHISNSAYKARLF